jgi:hypothetical protein
MKRIFTMMQFKEYHFAFSKFYIIMANQVQSTPAALYRPENLIFQDPIRGSIPGSTIPYQRINLKVKYPNGGFGDLIIPTESLFSFGVSENLDPSTHNITGFTLPLCLFSKGGATAAEKQWVDVLKIIEQQCKEHVIANRQKLGKFDLEMAELKKFSNSSFYWKRGEKGDLDPQGPTLYPKLITTKKDNEFVVKSQFYNIETGESLDALVPESPFRSYCTVRAAVKIESIFIGSKISLQVKLWEAGITVTDTGIRRLLAPAAPISTAPAVFDEDDDEEEKQHAPPPLMMASRSLENSEEDDDDEPVAVRKPAPLPAAAKAPVKRRR